MDIVIKQEVQSYKILRQCRYKFTKIRVGSICIQLDTVSCSFDPELIDEPPMELPILKLLLIWPERKISHWQIHDYRDEIFSKYDMQERTIFDNFQIAAIHITYSMLKVSPLTLNSMYKNVNYLMLIQDSKQVNGHKKTLMVSSLQKYHTV